MLTVHLSIYFHKNLSWAKGELSGGLWLAKIRSTTARAWTWGQTDAEIFRHLSRFRGRRFSPHDPARSRVFLIIWKRAPRSGSPSRGARAKKRDNDIDKWCTRCSVMHAEAAEESGRRDGGGALARKTDGNQDSLYFLLVFFCFVKGRGGPIQSKQIGVNLSFCLSWNCKWVTLISMILLYFKYLSSNAVGKPGERISSAHQALQKFHTFFHDFAGKKDHNPNYTSG